MPPFRRMNSNSCGSWPAEESAGRLLFAADNKAVRRRRFLLTGT
jgi:hypothetical protein